MTPLLAYVWTPALIVLLAVGLGLLVDRLVRWPLPTALLGPLGAATAIPITMTVYRLHGTGAVAAAIVAAGAVAGFVLSRRGLRARLRPGWAGAAALAAYALYVGPYAVTGDWTWGGYNFVNDPALNLIYADLLLHHGFTSLTSPDSSTTAMQTLGVQLHYPMGAHALLATLRPFAGIDVAAFYQPFIASAAAGVAAAFTHLARRAGAPGPAAAAIAVAATCAGLVYQYSQHGAIKEILMLLLIATAAAVLADALARGVRASVGVVLALCLAPMLIVFSIGGAPYALLIAAFGVAALVVAPKRPPLRLVGVAAVAGLVTGFVAVAPVLGDLVSFGSGAGSSFEAGSGVSTAEFGHLLRPLPAYQAAGVWLGEDYRLPVPPGATQTIQTALIVLVLAMAAVGLIAQLRRRRFEAAVVLAACGLVAILVAPRVAPYADAKLLLLLSPAIVLMAGLGIWELARGRRSAAVVAAVAAAACGGGILWTDAIAAHEVRLAPTDRMNALQDAARHAGGGYWLINEWEEYSKYFARSIRNDAGMESDSPDVVVLREPGPIFGQYFDLDEQTLEFVERFDGIMLRRSPVASRPPANFDRVYANEYYELWRRDPATTVLEHLPLGNAYESTGRANCARVQRLARRASGQGAMLVAAPRNRVQTIDVARLPGRPLGWVPDPNRPKVVSLLTPGRVHGWVRTPAPGTYRVWLQLSTGRPMEVTVDGRLIGAPHAVNGPRQWLAAGEARLDAGDHRVELFRGGGNPAPGDGYGGELGPVALEPVAASPPLVRVDPRDPSRLCGQRWDWIEVVRP